MSIDDLVKSENERIIRAFASVVSGLLMSKGIKPVINESVVDYDENEDVDKYIIRKEYNITFDIDTSEHDKEIFKEIYNRLDEGVCDICEFKCKDCSMHCDEFGREIFTFKKWLESKIKEQ